MLDCSQDMRQQLNEERQNVRRITLQREVETKELRNTIENQVMLSRRRPMLVINNSDWVLANRHGTFKKRAVRLLRQRRLSRTSNNESRSFRASYRATQRSWLCMNADHWELE